MDEHDVVHEVHDHVLRNARLRLDAQLQAHVARERSVGHFNH